VSLPGSADASTARFDADLRARIVVGLGVPVEALAGVETGELIERLGQLVRLAADDLHRRFNEKLAVSRRLRPRARPGRRFRDHNPFRAGDTGASLAMMLVADPNGPQAAVKVFERSRAELADFRNRLDRSVDRAVAQLGAELAPAAIEAHCQAAGATPSLGDAAWELYRLAWDDLDPDWQQGFRAAFDQFVAQALDDEQ
jgi:predicted component of type VI protein secretion system